MNLKSKILLVMSMWCVAVSSSWGYVLNTSDVASGYSDCSMIDNGNGTSTASVTISYTKLNYDRLGGNNFLSRGVLFYTYDKNGIPHNDYALSVTLGGFPDVGYYEGEGYIIYYGGGAAKPPSGDWAIQTAFRTRASVTLPNSILATWSAVSVRAGNFTNKDDIGEVTGGAYISVGNETGSCTVIDPSHPPPPVIHLTVNAPDWDLGEIKPGEQRMPFSASKDQLCLKYTASAVASKQFIITASSQNGEVNNQYQLKNQDDGSQIIPYQLALDSGSQQLTLPNKVNKSLPLEAGGQTCFMPMFKTFAPKDIKKGDYSDVLTFNIVTKS